jgi:hypothetical protein
MPFRDRTPRRLLLELAGIVAVFGTAAFLIWWFTRPPSIHNVRPVGGLNMDISHDARAQWAPSAAIDAADPDILLAGSSDELQDTRVYSSRDGGSRNAVSARLGRSPSTGATCSFTFAEREDNGTMTVSAAVLDRALRPVRMSCVGPADDGPADQFTPTSTIDRSNGDLWACFYDTTR